MSDQHNGTGNGTGREVVPFEIDPRTVGVGTDFLMYAVGGGANIEAQVDYQNDPQRSSGALPGIARSNFQNKATRQGTFVAHSLCLWISQQINQYVPDDGNDIAWIGSYVSALNQLILAAIPPGPNLGAYLPLIGGTMVGHIYFQPGITTILSNNTWYYSKDTGGTARGLILKGTDNNIYINDGSAPYVQINGIPTINTNNVSLTGKDTGGALRPLIGLLSDNSTHVGGGQAGHIYLDTAGSGSVWSATNIVIPNNFAYYAKQADGAAKAILSINTGNSLLIGSGAPGSTEIYAASGQPINAHNQLQSLGVFVSYGYSYLAGGRAYIPGGNDPWQIYADAGYYARIRFVVGGLRDWSLGVYPGSGLFSINDETGAAVRFQIATNGTATFFGNLVVNGSTTVSNGLTIAGGINITSGLLTASGGASIGNGLTVYSGLSVLSGNVNISAALGVTGAASVGGGLTVSNALNVASGRVDVAGPTYLAGGLGVWNGQTINTGNFNVAAGTISCSGAGSIGGGLNVYNGLTVQSGNLQAGYILSTGAAQVNNGLTVYNSLNVVTGTLNVAAGISYLRNQLQVWNHLYVVTGHIYVQAGALSTASNVDCGNTCFVRNQAQVWNWVIIKSGGLSVEAGDMNCSSNSSIGGHAWIYNGLDVWNSLVVQTGNFTVNGAAGVGGGLTVYNGFNVQTGNAAVSNGSLNINGDLNVGNTAFIRNQAQVWNWVIIYSGGLQIHDGNSIFVYNGGGIDSSGAITARGGVTIYNNLWINTGNLNCNGSGAFGGGLSVWGGLWVNTGGFDLQGTAYIRNGCNVYNSLVVQTGVFTCYSDSNTSGWVRGGGIWTGGDLYSGNASMANTHVNQLQVGGLPYIYDRGDGMLVVPINTHFTGSLWVNGTISSGNINNGDQIHTNWVFTNALQNYGSSQINGNETVNGGCYVGGLMCYGGATINGPVTVNNNGYCTNEWYATWIRGYGVRADWGFDSGVGGVQSGGNIWLRQPQMNGGNANQLQWTGYNGRGYTFQAMNDWLYFGWNDNAAPPVCQQWIIGFNAGGLQILVGNGYKPGGGAWGDSSERRFKKDIADYECDLDVLRQLRPRRYRFNGEDESHPDDGKTYYGFIADEVEGIMPELVHEYDRGGHHGKVKAIDITPMFYAMLNSINVLAARVEALEAGRA